jgi:hypothetical protein
MSTPNPMATAPASSLDSLAYQVLDKIGAQRDMPTLPVSRLTWLDRFSLNMPTLVLAAIAVVAVAALLTAVLRYRGRAGAWDMRASAATADTNAACAHLAQAEAYAAEGRYMEAMHEVLLQSLSDIRAHSFFRLDASLTSREILNQSKLPPSGRDALGNIIQGVEFTYFGLRPATATEWHACRAAFENLRQQLGAASLATPS